MMCAAYIRGDGKARRMKHSDQRRVGVKRRLDRRVVNEG